MLVISAPPVRSLTVFVVRNFFLSVSLALIGVRGWSPNRVPFSCMRWTGIGRPCVRASVHPRHPPVGTRWFAFAWGGIVGRGMLGTPDFWKAGSLTVRNQGRRRLVEVVNEVVVVVLQVRWLAFAWGMVVQAYPRTFGCQSGSRELSSRVVVVQIGWFAFVCREDSRV